MTVTLHALRDFYTLQALSAAPDLPEKLRPNVRAELSSLSGMLARCFRDYLFMVCMGEGRHAETEAFSFRYQELRDTGGRGAIYKDSVKYDPAQNLPLLFELFDDQKWCGSFGGAAWAGIAEFCQRYGEISDGTFVDHVVDLEHNGGNVFNKIEAKHYMDFNLDDHAWLKYFLNWKFSTLDFLGTRDGHLPDLSMSVGRLLVAYANATGRSAILKGLKPRATAITYKPITWGEAVLTDRRSGCQPSDEDEDDSDDDDQDEEDENEEEAPVHECDAAAQTKLAALQQAKAAAFQKFLDERRTQNADFLANLALLRGGL